MFWMGDMRCTKIQSFGGLYHFRKEQKPKGAASRLVRLRWLLDSSGTTGLAVRSRVRVGFLILAIFIGLMRAGQNVKIGWA